MGYFELLCICFVPSGNVQGGRKIMPATCYEHADKSEPDTVDDIENEIAFHAPRPTHLETSQN